MALDVQTKLLRAIENQEYQPVGTNRTYFTDIRFICATNKDLEEMVAKKQFSPDLYYRISAITLNIPPLRERSGDILLLLEHFLGLFGEGSPPRLTLEVKNLLDAYTWPGNVRELKNFVESICILNPGEIIDRNMLPKRVLEIASERYNQLSTEATEKILLADAMKKCSGNQSEVARMLSIPLSTLRRKLRKYGLL
jgi:DNA-binding NtrC family response regulator